MKGSARYVKIVETPTPGDGRTGLANRLQDVGVITAAP